MPPRRKRRYVLDKEEQGFSASIQEKEHITSKRASLYLPFLRPKERSNAQKSVKDRPGWKEKPSGQRRKPWQRFQNRF
jgi:hypothetical protein